jgi:hypothetical protein
VKLARRIFLLISLMVILLSITGVNRLSELANFQLKPEVEKNFFNGLPGSNNQILAVKIDDSTPAHPQIGVEDADLVYVEQVEGGITRLAAIYTLKLPPLIGPIRSARISDLEILSQFGRVGFAYSGAQSKMRPVIAAANLENLSAERNPPSIYGKDPNRPGPVDMILKPDLLLERANANPKIRIDSAVASPFIFGEQPAAEAFTSSVKVKWPSARYELRWDVESSKWLIYFNDKPKLAASGLHLYADTAIIQIVSITPSIYGDKFGEITPFSKTTGSGKAVLLRDGFAYPVDWQRNLESDVTSWRSADGKDVKFKAGKIWILLTDKPPVLAP